MKTMRENRIIVKSSKERKYFNLNKDDQLLILSKGEQKIVAEYEIKDIQFVKDDISIRIEPIYNAPRDSGVKIDDLTLIKLHSYSSSTHWKYNLKQDLTKIQHEDFQLLSHKLIGYT